ncbi:Uncharacterized protein Adt_28182 [Abeliophyllum distichum]|uniref:Retrotransposon Copia-like N-terminal domain-containing protein n=1 Tax=Abeliophyllum distichum TaxID=126358 RepID=A0ABD1RX23_9LAMI
MANTSHSNQSHESNSNVQDPTLLSNPSPFSMNLTQAASVKLDRDNFLLWKNIIMPIVRGHGLEEYLLGTKVCPPRFVNSESATESGTILETIHNTDYTRWI